MKSMNTLGTAAALVALLVPAEAQYTPVALESFDYAAGTNLDMQNGGAKTRPRSHGRPPRSATARA